MSDGTKEKPPVMASAEVGYIRLYPPHVNHSSTVQEVLTKYVDEDEADGIVALLKKTKGTDEYTPMQIGNYGYNPIKITVGQYVMSINFGINKNFTLSGMLQEAGQEGTSSALYTIAYEIHKKLNQ